MGAISVYRGLLTVVDRLFIGSRKRLSCRWGALGTPASGRHPSSRPRWHGAQTHHGARRLLRQPRGVAGQQRYCHVLHVGARHANLSVRFEDGDNERLKIDIGSGATAPIAGGPDVKLLPTILPSGEIAYLRRDKMVAGVFYGSGKPGPKGADLRILSWSLDGAQVVDSRLVSKHPPNRRRYRSRIPNFEMYSTAWLPAYDPSGEHLAVTHTNADGETTSLFVVDEGAGALHLEREDFILVLLWSPDGKQIVVGVGNFTPSLFSMWEPSGRSSRQWRSTSGHSETPDGSDLPPGHIGETATTPSHRLGRMEGSIVIGTDRP